MCMASAKDGLASPWHLMHYGSFAIHGASLTIFEATSVSPEGRISPEDLGLWNDEQAAALKTVVDFIHSQGQYCGIQLAHAGRKASTVTPWISFADVAVEEVGGWPDKVKAPSAIKFGERYPNPQELTLEEIDQLKKDFISAAKRATDIGIDVIEIHAAHGYLNTEFLSPATNVRTDKYGGSYENRTRLLFELIDGIREVIPETTPLFVRISATEGLEHMKDKYPESWTMEDSKKLAKQFADGGKVDLIDISSLGNNKDQNLFANSRGMAYQAPYSKEIKEVVGDKLLVSAVGRINDAKVADELLKEGLDMIMVGRFFLRNPGLVWSWADDLGVTLFQAQQYAWGFYGRQGKPKRSYLK